MLARYHLEKFDISSWWNPFRNINLVFANKCQVNFLRNNNFWSFHMNFSKSSTKCWSPFVPRYFRLCEYGSIFLYFLDFAHINHSSCVTKVIDQLPKIRFKLVFQNNFNYFKEAFQMFDNVSGSNKISFLFTKLSTYRKYCIVEIFWSEHNLGGYYTICSKHNLQSLLLARLSHSCTMKITYRIDNSWNRVGNSL